MEDRVRIRIVASIDIVVSIFIILLGISFFIFYGAISENNSEMINLYEEWASEYEMENPFRWMEGLPWIVIILGLIFLIYGSERLINNILKLITTKKQQIKQLNVQSYPIEPPNMYKR